MDYAAILWPWFGTFEVLPSRAEEQTKKKVEEYLSKKRKKNATEEKSDSNKTS
jgi:hypothetical protein